MDISEARITEHARTQMIRRGIRETDVLRVITDPEEVVAVREGRLVAQGMVGEYLLRVFLDIDRDPPEVATVYRTSKIAKYRRQK
jgi:hypothetical protein